MKTTVASGTRVFPTVLGPCGIAWSGDRVKCIQLPEATEEATLARLRAKAGVPLGEARAPRWVSALADSIARHLKGEKQSFDDVPLDMDELPPFHRKAYEAARRIGPSRTATYGEVAALAGNPGGARAVGQALAKNPFPIVVPCHRIVAAGGKPGGFSSFTGLDMKERLLASEGVALPGPRGEKGLSFDWDAAEKTLRAADPALARLMEQVPPDRRRMELRKMSSPFESLLEAIVYQQLHGKAAATILGRVKALFPRGQVTPRALLDATDGSLRGAGLSRAKTAAIRDLAARTLDGTVPSARALRDMPEEEIVERLTAIRGIGRWTVEMLLIFRLGRPDVLPATDYGVRKGFQRALRKRAMPEPKDLLRHGERWRPFRTVASWYLWRATEL